MTTPATLRDRVADLLWSKLDNMPGAEYAQAESLATAAIRLVVDEVLDAIAWIDISDDEYARGRNSAFIQCDRAIRSLAADAERGNTTNKDTP